MADAHDDPGHVTWGWKDQALGKKTWYYAKVLRRKATLISLDTAPYFYALSENYGSPEEDHLVAYREGRLTLAAKQVYEALLEWAMNTIDLRRAARMTSKTSDSEFARALDALQADFKILPVGVAEAGACRYAFIYDIVPRHMPELIEHARSISEADARSRLVLLYLRSVGAAMPRDIVRLFGWSIDLTHRTIQTLESQRKIVRTVHDEGALRQQLAEVRAALDAGKAHTSPQARRLCYSGSVGEAEVTVHGPANVQVSIDEKSGETVVVTSDGSVVRIKKAKK